MDSAEARHTASRSASAERFRRPATRSHLWNLPTNTLHNTCAWPGYSAGNALVDFTRQYEFRPNSSHFARQDFAARGNIEATKGSGGGTTLSTQRSYGGEAGIRTLGRTLKALQRFSKPPPSASRPPHRDSPKYRVELQLRDRQDRISA